MRTPLNKKPSVIFTSDWHLREDTPICYTGDYQKEQWDSVDFISDLQKQYNCSVINAGDLFDHWKPSPNLLRQTIEHIPNNFYSIYGQHDLPQHNLQLVNKCGMNVLQAADKLTVLDAVHWGQKPDGIKRVDFSGTGEVLVWHVMNYVGRLPWPGCTDYSAMNILKKYSQYTTILTGDNHRTFTAEYQGRILINPGSLMRMDADQINHKPCVFLWYAEDNSIEQVFIPIEQGVISREHIERIKERNNRIDAFVSKLNTKWLAKLSFEDNMESFKKENSVRKSVMDIIYEVME
jgi:DNA repair exonuclease SbcCD nuclease subunit